MWIRTSDIRSDEFQNLEGASKEIEPNPMLGMHGIRYGITHPEILKSELKALKRVAEKGKTIGLLLPQVISVDEVKKVKEFLKEINFSDAKVGVMVETPAAVQIIRDLGEEGIDFISFGTNDLTQYILALDRNNPQVQHLYDEMHPAVLAQMEYVLRFCKRNNIETSICGQAGSKKEMAKFLVEKGIDSISVNADVAKEISDYVAELEGGTDREPREYEKNKELEERKDSETSEEQEETSEDNEEKLITNPEEAVEAIEKEKQEYLEEHPEETKEDPEEELVNDNSIDENEENETEDSSKDEEEYKEIDPNKKDPLGIF
jgi:phosphoenolpyruvate-protein kinase (PTS system EI component)